MTAYRDPTTRAWRYRATVRLPTGEKIRVSGTPSLNSKTAAQDAERAHITRTLNPVQQHTVTPTVTFGQFATRWWKVYQVGGGTRGANAATTLREKASHMQAHLLPGLKDVALADITNLRLVEFAGELRGKRLSEKSLKNIFTTLGTILRAAVEWGDLLRLPKLPRITPADPEWSWLDADVLNKIRAADIPLERKAAVLTAMTTGMRQGEQVALEWSDIDFERETIRIHRNRPNGTAETHTKGKKGRSVPLTDYLAELLGEMPREGHKVFTYSPYELRKVLTETLEALNVEAVTWHSLRHSCFSLLASAGVPLRKIQEQAGHVSIRTTEKYSHLLPGAGKEQILEALG